MAAIADIARVGVKRAAIPALRPQLAIAGDLELNSGDVQVFHSYVEPLSRPTCRLKLRHRLDPDGIVRETTLRALNMPADVRLSQLKINAQRLKALTGNLGNRFVVANSPVAQIEATENGVAVTRHVAVAGKPDRPSPDINRKIIQIDNCALAERHLHALLVAIREQRPGGLPQNAACSWSTLRGN